MTHADVETIDLGIGSITPLTSSISPIQMNNSFHIEKEHLSKSTSTSASLVSTSTSVPRPAGVRSKVTIDFIDDLTEEIHLDVEIVLHFQDPTFIQEHNLINKNVSPGEFPFSVIDPKDSGIFVPVFEFKQIRSHEHKGGFKFLVSKKTGIIYLYRTYRLVIREILELQRFPFDRQIFRVQFESFNTQFTNWSAPIDDMPAGIKNDALWIQQEQVAQYDGSTWILNWVKGRYTQTKGAYQSTILMGFSRKSGYYLFNFVFVIFLIVQASITCITIDPNDFGNRASLNFTLLLTIVAFRFVMSTYIPKIDYLTLLDIYNLLSVLMLSFVIVENFCVSYFLTDSPEDLQRAEMIDNIFALVFMCIWVVFNVGIFIGSTYGLFYQKWGDVERGDSQNAEYIQRVGGNFEIEVKNSVKSGLL